MSVAKAHQDRYQVARRRMVEEQVRARGIADERVLRVMAGVPRHLFVDSGMQDQAYGDYPLSIGEGQTISQPYIVALMTQALQLQGHEKVLEVGTGCGYQTAVLARLVQQVYTIERIKNLTLKARRILVDLGYRNIVMRVGDGTGGWTDQAPFDCILTAAASPIVPEPLVAQLAEGGHLVMPIGGQDVQDLLRITKKGGQLIRENLGGCRFVRLVGQHGWQRQREIERPVKRRSLITESTK